MIAGRSSRRWFALVAILLTDVIYTFAYVVNMRAVQTTAIPPPISDDLYYYLNVSRSLSAANIVNPWFGNVATAAQVPHLRFSLIFRLFHIFQVGFGGRDAIAVLLWNLVWTTLILIAASWMVRVSGVSPYTTAGAAALAFLMFVSTYSLIPGVYRFLRTGTFHPMFIQLPFYRSLNPQVAIVLVLLDAALLTRLFQRDSIATWVFLWIVEALAFAAFPYAALVILTATALALLLRRRDFSWSRAGCFFLAAAIADAAIFFMSGPPRHVLGMRSDSPIEWNPSLPDRTSMLLSVAVVAIAVATWVFQRRARDADPTAIAFALALLVVIWFGDIFIARGLEVSVHTTYLVPIVIAILFVGIVRDVDMPRLFAVIAVACLGYGMAAAVISARYFRPISLQEAALIGILQDNRVGPRDLVVAPPLSMTQETVWMPLVTHSRVLLDSYAQMFVPVEHDRIYWDRFALYRALCGDTSESVQRDLANEQALIAFVSRRNYPELFGPHRAEVLAYTRASLLTAMQRLERRPDAAKQFLAAFDRIVLIQPATETTFDSTAISRWLCGPSTIAEDGWRVTIGRGCR